MTPFATGGGQTGEDIRTRDWSTSPLGPIDEWPEALKAAVATVLSSPQPMFMAWGPDLISFFNDAYRPILGAKVNGAIGQSFADLWSDVWTDIEPIVAQALDGESSVFADMPLLMARNGHPEETWWSFSYSPLRDGSGVVRGMLCVTSETTEQVRSSAALRDLNETLERRIAERTEERNRIWQVSRDLLLVADRQGRWLSINPTWTRVLGWEEEELLGRTSEWIEHPDDRLKSRREVERLAAGQTTFEFENRFRTRDGSYRTLSWTAVLADDKIYASARDVTQERRGLAALRERDTSWQLSRDMLLRCTFDGRMTAVNPAWTEVLGWRENELLGTDLFELIHPDDLTRTVEAARELSQGIGHARFDNRYRHKNGSYRWIAWSTRSVEDQIYASGRDFTVERQQAEALKDFEDFARLALTSVGGVGVWTYDVASDRFTCDAAIADLYGLDAAQGAAGIPRAGFLANVHPDDMVKLRAVMAGGLQASGDLELEYRLRHPDGTVRWVLSRGHTYFDESGKPVRRTGVGIETTKQRQLEEALRQSQKMEAVGQLTGGLAHDFNNLLAGISGSLDMMQTRMQQGRVGELDRYLVAAQGASKRAAALTHRLLAFSRRQTLDPKPTAINALIMGMEDLVRRTVGPQIAVESVAAGGVWNVLVDPNQLENALLNLCINARDAMPDGGKLTIETANRWLDDRAARERDLPPGQYVSMCVSDNGTGMPPDVVERAFDPFFTTKPIGVGTGLGLSMIYGFARQSGGQARIYSEVGRGTMVCVYLPRHLGDRIAPDTKTDAPGVGLAEAGETVLVIDDEPLVRMLVVDVLEDLGYRAIEAGDGPQGLKVLRSDTRIDLLITDVGLPNGMNGRQVADAARELRPGLKVLFVTGYAENAVLNHGHLEHGMQVVTKPFQMDVLAKRIGEMIRNR